MMFIYPTYGTVDAAFYTPLLPATARLQPLPPIIHFLQHQDVHLEQRLLSLCTRVCFEGADLHTLCRRINVEALMHGYQAVIRIQLVTSQGLPSFPEHTVATGVVMIDLVSIR